MTQRYTATGCPCGHPVCKNWLVAPVANVQGVSFTRPQAEAVAYVLNAMEDTVAGHATVLWDPNGFVTGSRRVT